MARVIVVGLEADAVAVAAGELSVVQTANVLELAEANQGRPLPVDCTEPVITE